MQDSTRRALLATTGTAIATALAGCSGGGGATTSERTTGETDGQTTSTATSTTTEGATTTEDATTTGSTDDDGTSTESGSVAATVTVAPDGELRFAPDAVTVATGAAVEWEWDAGGHNVVVDDQPADGDWSGTDGGGSTTYDAGHTHRHTFAVAGTYSYYCSPHQGVGMTGEIVVG